MIMPVFNGSVYHDTCAIETQRTIAECSPGLEFTRACTLARVTRDAACGSRVACGPSRLASAVRLRVATPLRGYELQCSVSQPCTGVSSSAVFLDHGRDVSLTVGEGSSITLELTTNTGRMIESMSFDPWTGACTGGSCGAVRKSISVGRSLREPQLFLVYVYV
jgi:hypothetical protein